jgi:hypothetical protein
MDTLATSDDGDTIRRQPYIQQTWEMCRSFLSALKFIIYDAGRDPKYLDNHLLSYLSQDFIQSVMAMPLLINEGVHNICRREMRFILEMSVKTCYIQQKQYNSDVLTKLNEFRSILNSTNISIQKQLNLTLIPDSNQTGFFEEVGRFYGESSNYVHLSQSQISERIALMQQGRTSGKESPEEIETLNAFIARILACSLVLLFHSVPSYVAGDFLVEANGESHDWFFAGSKLIAMIDEHFDYKHERQHDLPQIRSKRLKRVSF